MIGNVSINFPIKNEFNSFKIDVLFSTNVLHILLIIETKYSASKVLYDGLQGQGEGAKGGESFFNRNYFLPRGGRIMMGV